MGWGYVYGEIAGASAVGSSFVHAAACQTLLQILVNMELCMGKFEINAYEMFVGLDEVYLGAMGLNILSLGYAHMYVCWSYKGYNAHVWLLELHIRLSFLRLLNTVLLRSVISVILMTYKMKNMCCSDVPIPRSALSVKNMPHFLSTTSLFYTSTSPTECPV
eukprot:1144531-Pelagomonas_calceolata.AAC.1